jgi:uncharacterized membrane protein
MDNDITPQEKPQEKKSKKNLLQYVFVAIIVAAVILFLFFIVPPQPKITLPKGTVVFGVNCTRVPFFDNFKCDAFRFTTPLVANTGT